MARLTCKTGFLLYSKVTLILVVHGLFVLLLLVRALSDDEERESPSWYAVFSPLFVFDALAVAMWFLYLVCYIDKLRGGDSLVSDMGSVVFPNQQISLLYLSSFAVGIPLKIAAEVLIAVRLEGGGDSIRPFIPGVLLGLLFLLVGVVATCEALSPVVKSCWSSFEGSMDCEEDCGFLLCLGYTSMYCRRCLYRCHS